MIDNEYVNYILKEYPAWKIKSVFVIGIDKYIGSDEHIELKIDEYEMFHDIPVEEEILFNIVNSISLNYMVSNDMIYHLKDFVCDYLSICIPSFGRKWIEFKKELDHLHTISIEQFN